MFLYYNKITKESRISAKYIRADISEKPEGLSKDVIIYKIVDNIPEYNPEIEIIEKSDITKTTDIFNNLEHIRIANQNYITKTL